MNANDLRNAILALNFIDRDQFLKATLPEEEWETARALDHWFLFTTNPVRFYTRAPDSPREALFALIQNHLEEGKTND